MYNNKLFYNKLFNNKLIKHINKLKQIFNNNYKQMTLECKMRLLIK